MCNSLGRTLRRTAPSLCFLLLILCLGARLPLQAQKNFGGSAEILFSLEKLQVTGSVLMIAAHPDDENTAVIAYFARGKKMHTGYLSLNRGEGGQNLLGPEMGSLIGLIRTQELLRAREIDGGVQHFTRVVDFGYSKLASETLEKWGRENVLRDMVWIIRKEQPDIIINRFSGTEFDGHGHHQSSALLSKDAFEAAADPNRFPEQLQWVQPWQARRLFWNTFTWRNVDGQLEVGKKRLVLPTGEYSALLGHSYQEIAGMSRSLHRSQTMGAPERKGEAKDFLVQLAGEPVEEDPLEGLDLSWDRVPGAGAVKQHLADALASFDFHEPVRSVPALLKARSAMLALNQDPLVQRKLHEVEELIARCTGLWLDASAAHHEVVPGAGMRVNLEMVNRSAWPVSVAAAVVEGQQGLSASLEEPLPLTTNVREVKPLSLTVPADYPISHPYWLKEPARNDRYQIAPEDEHLVGLPESPASFNARFDVLIGEGEQAQEIRYWRPVHHRFVDPMYGELVRPLVVTPKLTLELGQQSVLFTTTAPRRVDVTLMSHQPKAAGEVGLELPDGWKANPASAEFEISGAGEKATVSFLVTPPAAGAVTEVTAVATVDGRRYDRGMVVVSYPHFPPQTLFPRQTLRLVREPLELLSRKVGYVMGAGDAIPQTLEQMGATVSLLTQNDLARGDLSGFDAIITGVRAYNTRPDLVANQKRLLQYVQQGGTLITQYNTTRYFGAGAADPIEGVQLGPYPFEIGRDRVSVEDAPVTILRPEHPVLTTPNQIQPSDFEGWVQERGLYFPSKFDDRYDTVIATHDPGEESLSGGILYTRSGKGVFIFTSYSWFRQLPAGVPGACKLFANLVSAGKGGNP